MVNKTAKTKKPTSKKSVAAKKTSAKSKKTVVRKVSAKKSTAANISAANSSSKTNKTTAKRNYFRCFTAEFWRNALDIVAKHPKSSAFLLGALLTAALPPFYYTFALFIL